ncbi:hypothetical protein A3D00_00430 [Candidatus Woesebacteria bacterium RIFCSPHIGHO2_02_FULL_38_9]|uniref:TVP38/TMEM64 family membrane protein n=1 Tax=Candidatus Woesebacteria bacterium RIFCSPHIGHO2_01_FULL_39_28 TaxID=1802496 RepID=A0A1F7YKA6_9BACT|nr:MAG: hypothetical protein A2627_04680 [Candidatus Woesebacteria bacterium RIFCSPHIGHO2_01_FULL_39_28]OGM33197.1 MAG: hypothetical protein A3D00_00430 [Candidatus Woesebacteria bacterium RIFCSPHIGHO2_02_FULL_38_9]OGM57086.1 MAG: hypothetical protein A3A50_05485 [Candidatus Woesebacteria bacterium RIFCSPLOWO2_01_FULL_38_20]
MYHKHHFRLHFGRYLILVFLGIILIVLVNSGKFDNTVVLINFIKQHPFWGIFIYFIFMIISTIVVPIPSVPLWPVAIYLYGFWLAFALSAIGTIVGATINFVIAKKFGKPIVIKMISHKLYEEINHLVNIENTKMFFLIRVFGNNYFDTISYIAGLSRLSLKSYLLVTTPTSVAWVFIQMMVIQKLGGIENIKSFIAVMTFYGTVILFGTLMWETYHKHHLLRKLKPVYAE